MKKRYEIEVTQRDIDRAVKCTTNHCAVAEAIGRQVPGATRISVDVQTIRFSLPDDRKRLFYITPPSAVDYIVAFDAGEPIPAFKMRLDRLAAEVDMRPRTAPGLPRPERQNAIIYDPESKGTQVIAEGRKKIPAALRKTLMPHSASTERGKANERKYGKRVMRVNQLEDAN